MYPVTVWAHLNIFWYKGKTEMSLTIFKRHEYIQFSSMDSILPTDYQKVYFKCTLSDQKKGVTTSILQSGRQHLANTFLETLGFQLACRKSVYTWDARAQVNITTVPFLPLVDIKFTFSREMWKQNSSIFMTHLEQNKHIKIYLTSILKFNLWSCWILQAIKRGYWTSSKKVLQHFFT